MYDRHQHIDPDTLAAYAADALAQDEVMELGVHLRACADCQRELDSLREAFAAIPYGLPLTEPPAALRERVVGQARAARLPQPARPTVAAPTTQTRRRFAWWPRLAPALAAAAIVLAFVLGRNWPAAREPNIISQPDARVVTLTGTGRGTFVVTVAGQRAQLTIDRLPPLAQGKVYQLWLLGGDAPISAGTFVVDQNGRGQFTLNGLAWSPGYSGVAITPEPSGGRPAPSGQIVAQAGF